MTRLIIFDPWGNKRRKIGHKKAIRSNRLKKLLRKECNNENKIN